MSLAYRGPCTTLTPEEAARVLDALCGHKDATARQIVAKCSATLAADPRWREPTS